MEEENNMEEIKESEPLVADQPIVNGNDANEYAPRAERDISEGP